MYYLPRKLWLIKEQWIFNSSFLSQVISHQVEKNSERNTLGRFGRFKNVKSLWRDVGENKIKQIPW